MGQNVSYHVILISHRKEFSAEHRVGSHLELSDINKIQSSPALGDLLDFQFVYTISPEESVHFEFSYVPSIHMLPTLEFICFVRKAEIIFCASSESIRSNKQLLVFWHSDLALSRDILFCMMEIHNFPSSLSMNGAGQKDEFGVVEIDDESVAVDTEVVLCTILEADSGVEVLIDGLGTGFTQTVF